MPFTRNGIIPVALVNGSPSLQPNNLSAINHTVAYIHLNDLYIQPVPMSTISRVTMTMSGDRGKKVPVTGKCYITQASYISTKGLALLVVTTSSG